MGTTRICAVICESLTEAARAALRRAAGWADLAEVRADYIQDLDTPRLLAQPPLPVIFTCRSTRQGGRFSGDEAARLAILRTAVDCGADYIDLEDDADSSAVFSAGTAGRCLISYHNFDHTPDDLEAIYRRLRRRPAAVVKIVTQANTLREAQRVLDLLIRHRADSPPLIACAMGPRGLFTRVLGPRCGSFLTYAALEEGRASASGQLSLEEMVEVYRIRALGASTRVLGLLGTPLGHSLSPAIHNAALGALGLDSIYLPFDSDDWNAFMDLAERLPLDGFSVTVPYKAALLPRLATLNPVARARGAVNTVVRTPTGWAGYNTDVDGFLAPLLTRGPLRRCSVTVLGAGGAARAAAYALLQQGASVLIVHRAAEKARALAAELGGRSGPLAALSEPADWLVNATPVGMYPRVDDTPVPPVYLKNKKGVYDLVYNPYATRLLQDAAAAGAQIIRGLDMFLAQAARQFQIWTGRDAPVDLMRATALDGLSHPRRTDFASE